MRWFFDFNFHTISLMAIPLQYFLLMYHMRAFEPLSQNYEKGNATII